MMSKELQNLLCSCSSGCIGNPNYKNSQQRNSYNSYDYDYPSCESDRDEKLLDDWKVLDDDSWDVISGLRQKFCQLSKSEAESATVRESPRSSCTCTNRQPIERRSLVEKVNDLIDYTPESEFLRKIKQQCQYLQNRLPNIFSALNDCFPEGEFNECQKCLALRSKAQHNDGRSWKCCSQQQNFNNEVPYRDKKMRMKRSSMFQRPCSARDGVYPLERLKADEKKSDHISRSKKRDRSRRIRKRKTNYSPKCLSENEPSLKKPNENSCERCWRFASPARSPVNKPDQRYDPNYRRGHSTTSVPKGEGDVNHLKELGFNEERNNFRVMDRENQFSKHACDTTNRSPVNGSQPFIPPHICVKQKIEAPWSTGPNSCPKHGYDTSQFPNEYANFPSPDRRGCSQNRSNLQQSPSPPRAQHICPKHTGSLQQYETSNARPKPKCSIHEPDPSEQRYSQQRSPQKPSPQFVCSSTERSSQPSVPQQRYPQERIFQQRCPQQASPRPGTSYNVKHTCQQPCQESSRKVFSTCPKAKPQRPQTCGQGSKSRSPTRVEDLDETEYKEICTDQKKQNYSSCPDPCSRGETPKKYPLCGTFPPKPPKLCDRSKMETIPEDPTKKTEGEKSDSTGRAEEEGGTGSSRYDSQSTKQSKTFSKDSQKETSKKSEKAESSKKGKSEKSDADSKKGKSEKSDGDSKKDTKKDKSDGKGKKSSDKEKPTPKDRKTASGKSGKNLAGTCGARKPSQFDKAHPLRPCKCPPRIPETDQPPGSYRTQGQTLCCHCNWEEENNNQIIHHSQREGSRNGSQNCYCNTPHQSSSSPERGSPIPKGGTMECPYRAFLNKFGSGGPQPNRRPQQEENRRCLRENQSEISTQELLQCTPRKYFMFYMTQEKEKNNNNKDMEVLVEELEPGCSKTETASRTKDIREKMKKIKERPPDSMALRFQKGVSEVCSVPQNSRMLYF